MTKLTKLLLAGAAVPLVLAAHSPSHAAGAATTVAASELVVAQASDGSLRERLRTRRDGREERRERRRGAAGEDDEEDEEDEDEAQAAEEAEEAETAEERESRERRRRERAAEEEAERERAAQEEEERDRAAREEAERQRAQAEEAERQRVAEEEAERQRAAEEEAERRAAEEDAERERAAEEEAERRAAEEDAERERAAQEEAERRAAEDDAERERAAQEEAERRAAEEDAERDRAAQQEAEQDRAEREETERQRASEEEAEREREQTEEPGLRERLRERRQRERAEEPVEPTEEPVERVEEPEADPVEETAEEPEERPGLGERIRRSLMGEDEPEVAQPETAEEQERLRERRQRERADEPRRRERAREAQRDLDEIVEDREELRDEVRERRRQREVEVERIERDVRERGAGEVVQRRGDRVIIRSENNYFIQNNDMRRFMRRAEDVETRRRDDRYTETVVRRRDGTSVVTLLDEYGDIALRTRILADGREIVLIDNRRRGSRWREDRRRPRIDYYSEVLPPLVISIPLEEYIVESRSASRRDIRRALTAPPVERVTEVYSLEDVLYNERIRDMVPRVDLDTITFEFDSAEVPDDQIDTLEEIGLAIEEIIAENPRELFLLEGHTDWPGSHEYNLALSDRRAENVAIILTEFFDIPPENLITQGYGKQYLKIQTEGPERRNRRVTARRITDLMAEAP